MSPALCLCLILYALGRELGREEGKLVEGSFHQAENDAEAENMRRNDKTSGGRKKNRVDFVDKIETSGLLLLSHNWQLVTSSASPCKLFPLPFI